MTKWIPSLLTVATLAAVPASAQTPAVPAANPLQGNADAIKAGMGSSAHAAPTATAWTRAASARRTSRRSGRRAAPTTGCSRRCKRRAGHRDAGGRRRASTIEVWKILAYLRTLAAPAPTDPPSGNAENGERLFRANCAELPSRQRHRRPARSGPLARRRRARPRGDGAPDPRRNRRLPSGYEPVTITPTNGQPIHGVKKNEDLFSVQIMDARERIQGYEKDDVRAVADDTQVGDAGVRPRSAERKRPRRPRSLPADAARIRSAVQSSH